MQEVLNTLEPLARASLEALFESKRSSSQSIHKSLCEEEPSQDLQHENQSFAGRSETGESSESSSCDGSGDTKFFDGPSATAQQSPR